MDYSKIKNFCSVKHTVKRMKDEPRLGGNICKTHFIKDIYLKYTNNS